MTSKEAYERRTLSSLDPDGGFSPEFAIFDAGWKAAIDEAVKAVMDTDEARVPGSASYYAQLGDACQQRSDCADAVRALK